MLIEFEGGTVTRALIAMTNVSDTTVWSEAAANAITGTSCDHAAVRAAVQAMLGDIDPQEDNRGPIAFKRHVAGVILKRSIARAHQRA